MDIEAPFSVQEGTSPSLQNSRETLINMFAQPEVSGKSRILRRQRVGVVRRLSVPTDMRCIERYLDTHYLLISNRLYSWDGSNLIFLGTIGSTEGRCTMVFDDIGRILIADGERAYYYNGSTIRKVDTPRSLRVGYCAYLGGYGIVNEQGTGTFYITGLSDFSTINALDFASAESAPDPIIRPFVDHNELWLFGRTTTEIRRLSGGDFPFSAFSAAQLERGILAPFAVAAEDNTIFFVGNDGIVYRANGYTPMRISTTAIEQRITAVSAEAKALCDCFVYVRDGNKFLTITFGDELTVQYNIATGLWNRARTYGHQAWRITGGAGTPTDYYLSPTGIVSLETGVNTDEGLPMERGGISAPAYANGKRIVMRSLFVDCEVGRADINKNTRVMMRVARDGETFGNERWRELGSQGNYTRRAVWRNMGIGRSFVVELMATDDFEFTIASSFANYERADA